MPRKEAKKPVGKRVAAEDVVLALLAELDRPASLRDIQLAAFRVGRKSPAAPSMRRMSRTDYFLALHRLRERGDVLQQGGGAQVAEKARDRAENLRKKISPTGDRLAASH